VSRPRSLRARITLAALAAVAVAGLIAGALMLRAVDRDGRQAIDRELRQRAAVVMRRVGGPAPFQQQGGPGRKPPPGVPGGGRGQPGPPPGEGDDLLLSGSGTFTQVAYRGRLVDRRGDVPSDPPGLPATNGLRTVRIGGKDWRSITVPSSPDGDVRVEILTTLAPVEERVDRIRRDVLVIGLGALALTALAAWAFTTFTLRPLARLRAGAARVTDAGALTTPLPDDDGPEEVRSLANALNEMLARLRESTEALQRALDATRRFAADAGHELRTPLTGLRADLDSLERNPDLPVAQRLALVREMQAEQARILHLLEGLQALARGEAAERLPREEVELADLVDAALFGARRRHPGVEYELEENVGDAAVLGWPGGLRLLVDNLLDNAALHGRPGGGHVLVTLERQDDGLSLSVQDDGPGVSEDERARLLEPFTRAARPDVPGSGLGLAIVAQQAALHGGDVRLADSRLGGLAVHVRLPSGSGRPAPVASPPEPAPIA
jgi:signal transduction histidine kinase